MSKRSRMAQQQRIERLEVGKPGGPWTRYAWHARSQTWVRYMGNGAETLAREDIHYPIGVGDDSTMRAVSMTPTRSHMARAAVERYAASLT